MRPFEQTESRHRHPAPYQATGESSDEEEAQVDGPRRNKRQRQEQHEGGAAERLADGRLWPYTPALAEAVGSDGNHGSEVTERDPESGESEAHCRLTDQASAALKGAAE